MVDERGVDLPELVARQEEMGRIHIQERIHTKDTKSLLLPRAPWLQERSNELTSVEYFLWAGTP